MTPLIVDLSAITAAGTGIRDAGQLMPDPGWGPECSTGSVGVDGAMQSLSTTVGQQLLGSAAEMIRIGQSAIDSAEVYRTTDANL
jgi:hypothetical protein